MESSEKGRRGTESRFKAFYPPGTTFLSQNGRRNAPRASGGILARFEDPDSAKHRRQHVLSVGNRFYQMPATFYVYLCIKSYKYTENTASFTAFMHIDTARYCNSLHERT